MTLVKLHLQLNDIIYLRKLVRVLSSTVELTNIYRQTF